MFIRPRALFRDGRLHSSFRLFAPAPVSGLLMAALLSSSGCPARADAAAEDVLKRMAAVYALNTFQGKATMSMKGVTDDNKPFNVSSVEEVAYKSPNLFYVKNSGTAVQGTQIRAFNGKEFVTYISTKNQYVKLPVPAGANAKIPIPLLSLFDVRFDPQSGKMLPPITFGGKAAYVIQVMPPLPQLKPGAPAKAREQLEQYKKMLVPYDLVIDKSNYHLLRVTQNITASKMTKTMEITQQTLNPNLPDSAFAFTPPPGAKPAKMNGMGGAAGGAPNRGGAVSKGGGNPLPPPHASVGGQGAKR